MRSKQPIDYQLDYMERLFWEIRCKKMESYVIHRIWDRLNDARIRFEIQQMVKFWGGSRKLVGISIQVGNAEKEELLIHNASEVCSKEFDFSIERFSHSV